MTGQSQPSDPEFLLAAQIPAVPPDETPSLEGVRQLSGDEARQLLADIALVRKVVVVTPYQRAVAAYQQLFEAADSAATSLAPRLTARAASAVGRGLSAVAYALRELPDALAQSLAGNLPDDADAVGSFVGTSGDATEDTSYRLATQLYVLRPERLRVARRESGFELVATSDDMMAWADAAGLDRSPDALGILSTVEAALGGAARIVSHWLLEQREVIDDSCRRIAAVDGEVFQGPSFVMEMVMSDDAGATAQVKNLHPLRLEDVYAVQFALARAQVTIGGRDREPARRGPSAMSAETIEAIVATGQRGAVVGRTEDEPEEHAKPDARARSLDMPSLIAHLQLGAMRLERAWSRALDGEDVAVLAGEWASLLQALVGELQHGDETLTEEERYLDLPPTLSELAALIVDPAGDDRRRHVAQAMAVADLVALVPLLTEPTNQLPDGSGRRVEWFSSGAFASLRRQLELVAALLEIDGWALAASADALATRARVEADPLAEVVHLSRAIHKNHGANVPAEGTDGRVIFDQLDGLARGIAEGDAMELPQVFLCALAARELVADVSPHDDD
jgi:hypothetical protein